MRSRSNELPPCDWLVLLHYLDGRTEIFRTDGTFDEAVAFGANDVWPLTAAVGMTVLAGNNELAAKIDEHAGLPSLRGAADGEAVGGFDPGAFGIASPAQRARDEHRPKPYVIATLMRTKPEGLHEQVREAMSRADLVLVMYGPDDGGFPVPLHEEAEIIEDAVTDTDGKVLLRIDSWRDPVAKAGDAIDWAMHHARRVEAPSFVPLVFNDEREVTTR